MGRKRTFGEMLRSRREQWGDSINDMENRLWTLSGRPISAQMIRSWEAGRSYPQDEKDLELLCDRLAFDFVRMKNKIRREKLERREKTS